MTREEAKKKIEILDRQMRKLSVMSFNLGCKQNRINSLWRKKYEESARITLEKDEHGRYKYSD